MEVELNEIKPEDEPKVIHMNSGVNLSDITCNDSDEPQELFTEQTNENYSTTYTREDGATVHEEVIVGDESDFEEEDEEELSPEEQAEQDENRMRMLTLLSEYIFEFPDMCSNMKMETISKMDDETIEGLLASVRRLVQRANSKAMLKGSFYMFIDIGEVAAVKYLGMNCAGISNAIQSDPNIHRSVKQFAIEYAPQTYYDPLLVLTLSTASMFKTYSTQKTLMEAAVKVDEKIVKEFDDL